jgi:uncharacterized protein YjbI with pentapeptide repeats
MLRQALFTKAKMPGSVFQGADLYQAHMAQGDWTGCDFRHAELTYADFRHAQLNKADLRQATLMRTCLHATQTTDAQMTDRARAIESDEALLKAERWQPIAS